MSAPRLDARHAPTGRVLRIGALAVVVRPRPVVVTAVLLVLVLALGLWTLGSGAIALGPREILDGLLGQGESRTVRVVRGIRVPRTAAALCAGACLGISGALFQSLSRNALGSPDVIGLTTGAATGALVQLVLLEGDARAVIVSAVIGGLGTAAVVVLLSRRAGSTGGRRLVLVGIGVGAVLGGVNSLLLVKGDLDNAIQATLWLAGSLDARTPEQVIPSVVMLVLALPAAVLVQRSGAILENGEDAARQLGVRAEATRLTMMLLGVLLAAAATATCGPIAFIALAAPQLARRLTRAGGPSVVAAAVMGALLLTAADAVTQLVPLRWTLPVGRMTGVLGGIYLLWLLTTSRDRRLP